MFSRFSSAGRRRGTCVVNVLMLSSVFHQLLLKHCRYQTDAHFLRPHTFHCTTMGNCLWCPNADPDGDDIDCLSCPNANGDDNRPSGRFIMDNSALSSSLAASERPVLTVTSLTQCPPSDVFTSMPSTTSVSSSLNNTLLQYR